MRLSESGLALFVCILAVNGYPLVAGLSELMTFPNFVLSILMRTILVLISAILILRNSEKIRLSSSSLMLLAVFFIYGLRLAFETALDPESLRMDPYAYWMWFIGSVIIPTLAILFGSLPDGDKILIWLSLTCGAAFLLIMPNLTTIVRFNNDDIDFGRASLRALNPNSVGNLGAAMVITGVWSAIAARSYLINRFWLWFNLSLIFSGLYLLVNSAARGSFIALLFCIFIIIMALQGSSRFRTVASVSFALSICAFYVVTSVDIEQLSFVRRLSTLSGDFSGDQSNVERMQIWADALQTVKESPFFGSLIENQRFHYDPHNVFVEYFMATGIFGGTFFILTMIRLSVLAFRIVRSKDCYGVFALIFFHSLVGSLFSGNLYTHTMLWVSAAVVISFSTRRVSISKFAFLRSSVGAQTHL